MGKKGLSHVAFELLAAATLTIGTATHTWFSWPNWVLMLACVPSLALCVEYWFRQPESLMPLAAWMVILAPKNTSIALLDLMGFFPVVLAMLHTLSSRKKPLHVSLSGWVLLAWILWCLISAVFSLSPAVSLKWTSMWAIGTLGWSLVGDPETYRSFWNRFGWATATVLVYSVIFSPFEPKLSTVPFFTQDNVAAGTLLAAILTWPLSVRGSVQKRMAWLWSILAGIWIFWISRGAMLGIAAGGLTLGLMVGEWKKLRPIVTIIGLVGTVFLLWPKGMDGGLGNRTVFSKVNSFSNEERMLRWELAFRMAEQRPWLGTGPGCFAPDFKHFLRTDEEVAKISYWPGWTGGAHQLWLGSIAETGWIGAFLLAGLAAMISFGLFGEAGSGNAGTVGYFSAWVALMVHLQVEDLLLEPGCFLAICALGGAAFLSKQNESGQAETS
jgi:O-antigen ligase